ncbi:cyclase [Mycobacterium asiaticum]|uniref:adenylate/guanylate cyclase domain-containing protein n=1 Tax=Mycobacterium asiaticum TaxID=1790 RepID=UPI0007F00EF5|nr:adenylate/guanylate cyclase domain-containing protein [Mycobacterium asiaticum]OBK95817.1 cyclase [Mycobacterium asiaticum]
MDRIWQWAWDRYKARYGWAISAISLVVVLPTWLVSAMMITAYEHSAHYAAAAAVTVAAAPLLIYGNFLPGLSRIRSVEQWAAGRQVDRAMALQDSYVYVREAFFRSVIVTTVWAVVISVSIGAIAGASTSRLVQYGIWGAVLGAGTQLAAFHSFVEVSLRPARIALTAGTEIGDSLPRPHPTFAAWTDAFMVCVAFVFALAGAMLAAVLHQSGEVPILVVAIACVLAFGMGVPITLLSSFSPSLQPIRDLAAGTARVTMGDYSQRLPVVQDDDLGVLAASFNRMQAGLAERQRLQAAFGTYVDPALATRLLEQGDDVFAGERREVTVVFIDIRDFAPYAEVNTAEDTVARLNALFEIVVPAVVDAGGHVNKFLGDGALAVFGAPNDLADHADAALSAAVAIHRLVAERFGGELRIGIGINTGVVIAGTIGGGGKLEFTLIGDAVNVAARVEQLTKTTRDAVLLTQQSADALTTRPPGLIDRGFHELKGKSDAVRIFALAELPLAA